MVVTVQVRPTVSATVLTTADMEVVMREADEMIAHTVIGMAAGGPTVLAALAVLTLIEMVAGDLTALAAIGTAVGDPTVLAATVTEALAQAEEAHAT